MKRVIEICGVAALAALSFGLFLGRARPKAPARAVSQAHRNADLPRETRVVIPERVAPLVTAARPPETPEPRQAGAAPSEPPDPAAEDELGRSAAEQAQLVRMPLLTAIRGNYTSHEQRYDAMRSALERSGPTAEAWSRQAAAVFDAWSTALGASAGTPQLDSTRCFAAGCELRVLFRDSASAERAASAFRLIPEETSTHGGRVQTPAVPAPEGGIQVTWMMLRPDLMPARGGADR